MNELTKNYQKIIKYIESNEQFSVFGAGTCGLKAIELLQQKNKTVVAIFDNDPAKHGKQFHGIQVLAPTKENLASNPIAIASTWHFEIAAQLKEMGVDNFIDLSHIATARQPLTADRADNLQWLYERVSDQDSRDVLDNLSAYISNREKLFPCSSYPQYLHPKITSANTVLDGGAFDCISTIEMLEHFGPDTRFYAFEPEKDNLTLCYNSLNTDHLRQQISIVEKGLWSKEEVLKFNSSAVQAAAGCNISESGDIEIPVTSVDTFLSENNVSPDFLKMDIEGAEIEALHGAKSFIQTHKPTLAICLYHHFDDFWIIPKMIDEMYDGYDMYIGHHSDEWFETVLYCIPA
ncbi:hypothetical protein N474_14060 [Pseudoalteromonas luteoviolacea CPMOR-2]|uniref:Methyltransferase FkbM domain-containing protein n=1 Tax=Pseudoalteromonas luteoviolacea DSM 6061 TaxID=1365250 RepID=A0A166VL65_9GAMM|nr:FkbM family methyltransferase [Pseudoalteromonas luteoviolacea]KZN32990.1 hypothetical protein N475_20940 [Pseudoalteromonas luteoviolacea DSM 6061]KZN55667.1 hypothetical protein N474_14060 [Pseudoalteromonas luteoviolacea CPMOR-2]MBE0385292.1 hypothetical protein [Pseudoalteromonas luteoviolacea DSM 6061]